MIPSLSQESEARGVSFLSADLCNSAHPLSDRMNTFQFPPRPNNDHSSLAERRGQQPRPLDLRTPFSQAASRVNANSRGIDPYFPFVPGTPSPHYIRRTRSVVRFDLNVRTRSPSITERKRRDRHDSTDEEPDTPNTYAIKTRRVAGLFSEIHRHADKLGLRTNLN
jgi:hypothetical protein